MTRATVMLCSVLTAALLPIAAVHAQSMPQLQTDNARRLGGETDGMSQLQTDNGRMMAEQEFMAAKNAQNGPGPGGPGGAYPQPQQGYGADGGQQQSAGGDSNARALAAAATADGLDLSSRYANRIIIGRNNQPLRVDSNGIVRPAPDDREGPSDK